jgi:hypothetical protein
MLIKFTGLDKIIEKVIDNLGDLERAYVVGNLAKGLNSEVVDLVFIGNIDKQYLFSLIEKVESIIDKKIKYILYTSDEVIDDEIELRFKDNLLLWSK